MFRFEFGVSSVTIQFGSCVGLVLGSVGSSWIPFEAGLWFGLGVFDVGVRCQVEVMSGLDFLRLD